MTVADDIKAARAEVEKGWCQKWYYDFDSVCAIGALNKVCLGNAASQEYYNPRFQKAVAEIYKHLPEGFGTIPDFNDDPKTKKQDVLDLFDKIEKHLPEGLDTIAQFNDAPTTTKQDILDLFDKALADLGAL